MFGSKTAFLHKCALHDGCRHWCSAQPSQSVKEGQMVCSCCWTCVMQDRRQPDSCFHFSIFVALHSSIRSQDGRSSQVMSHFNSTSPWQREMNQTLRANISHAHCANQHSCSETHFCFSNSCVSEVQKTKEPALS